VARTSPEGGTAMFTAVCSLQYVANQLTKAVDGGALKGRDAEWATNAAVMSKALVTTYLMRHEPESTALLRQAMARHDGTTRATASS
jgi:hypothetical protein